MVHASNRQIRLVLGTGHHPSRRVKYILKKDLIKFEARADLAKTRNEVEEKTRINYVRKEKMWTL